MIFGERLARMRAERGMTLRVLGDKAGCSAQFICDIERGRREASFSVACRVADALDCTVGDLNPMVRVPLDWVVPFKTRDEILAVTP